MALHTQLPIYKAAYELLDVAVEITRNIPRDFKRLIGEKVREECLRKRIGESVMDRDKEKMKVQLALAVCAPTNYGDNYVKQEYL